MDLFEFLDRPIAFHRPLVNITGSVTSALMLSQAIYWSRRTADPDGWFYKSMEDWRAETGMNRFEQEAARKALLKTGCWEERYERLHHRMWYRVISQSLSRMLKTSIGECGNAAFPNAGTQHSGIRETDIRDFGKPTLATAGNQHSYSTETTTETTTERLPLDLPAAKKKPKIGSVNGTKPLQPEIEEFCTSVGLPKTDGELMLLKWNADGWPKNWMDKIRYWKRAGYMPSQRMKPGQRPKEPVPDENATPPGFAEWLKRQPQFHEEASEASSYRFVADHIKTAFRRFRKIQLQSAA